MKNGSDSTSTKYSVFFLKNAQHNTKSLEVYLERRDFTVDTASTVDGGLKKINEIKPGYVFAAWDHADSNVQDIMSQVPEDTLVIPYITSTSNSDARKLMTVDAPLKMFPPLTGPAIQRLILKYEKEKSYLKSQNQSISTYKKDNSDSQTFVSKGQRFSDTNPVISTRPVKENLDLSSFDSVTDLTSDRPIAQFSEEMYAKISESQKKSLQANFDSKIAGELKEIIETAKEITPPEHQQTIYCVLVQAIDCSGLILLNTAWNLSSEDAQAALSSWANELTAQYHRNDTDKNIYQSEVFSVNVPAHLDVFELCQSKASVQKEILIDGKNTVLAFFDLKFNPLNLSSIENANYLSVDPHCLRNSSTISFDLFFQLKENNKMLKIFKKDSQLSDKEINSVSDKKMLPLLITTSDEMLWYKYGVEVYLKQL